MRKLGSVGALVCAIVAVGPVIGGDPVRADEPANLSSTRLLRAMPVVMTSRSGRIAATPDMPRATRASERRDDSTAGAAPWLIRGTLGMSDPLH
jgi:hypothetical protein